MNTRTRILWFVAIVALTPVALWVPTANSSSRPASATVKATLDPLMVKFM